MFDLNNFVQRLLDVLSLPRAKRFNHGGELKNYVYDLCPDMVIPPALFDGIINLNAHLSNRFDVIKNVAEFILKDKDRVFVIAIDTSDDTIILSCVDQVPVEFETSEPADHHNYFCKKYIYDALNNKTCLDNTGFFIFKADVLDIHKAIQRFNASESKVKILADLW